jgi:hypothetical protein
MLNALLISSIYVLDQDKALDFYVGKLGLEVNTDQDLGFMRWLTVNVPGDSRQILLEKRAPRRSTRRQPSRSANSYPKVQRAATCSSRLPTAERRTKSFGRRAWSLPRSPRSDPTGSTAGCAIHSVTTYDSRSRRRCPRRSQVPRRATVEIRCQIEAGRDHYRHPGAGRGRCQTRVEPTRLQGPGFAISGSDRRPRRSFEGDSSSRFCTKQVPFHESMTGLGNLHHERIRANFQTHSRPW